MITSRESPRVGAERMAARFVLAEVTLETLRRSPAVPYEEDEVTRVIDNAVNETIYAEIKGIGR